MNSVRVTVLSALAFVVCSNAAFAQDEEIYRCEDALVAKINFAKIPAIRKAMRYYNSDPYDGFYMPSIQQYVYRWMEAFPQPTAAQLARLYARVIRELAVGDREDFNIRHDRLNGFISDIIRAIHETHRETWHTPSTKYVSFDDLERCERVLNGLVRYLPNLIRQLSFVDEDLRETRASLILLIDSTLNWESRYLNAPVWLRSGGRGSWWTDNRFSETLRYNRLTGASRKLLKNMRAQLAAGEIPAAAKWPNLKIK
jgi:hypothetical protein